MKVFVDTNVFVYAFDASSEFHGEAFAITRRIDAGEIEGYASHQILIEFYSAVTKHARRPLPARDAAREVARLLDLDALAKLPVDHAVVELTTALAARHDIRGVKIFDAQIVATMLRHGIERLYTANDGDFARFDEIHAINPFAPGRRVSEPRRAYRGEKAGRPTGRRR